MKPTSIISRRAHTEPDEERPAPAPLPDLERRARASTVLPEGLRNLVDKVTARKQTASAHGLGNDELELAARHPNLTGRGARALHRELAQRRAATRPADEAPQAAPQSIRTSRLPNAMREALDSHTARTQIAQATRLDDAELARRLADPAARSNREQRALQREATKRRTAPADGTANVANAGIAADTADGTDDARVTLEADTAASVDAARRADITLPVGAVIDMEQGGLDVAHLQQTVTALAAALPEIPASAAGTRLRERLASELAGIGTIAADPGLRPDQRGLAIRDGFARASRAARVLARYLDRDHANHGNAAGGVPARERAMSYFLLAGLMTELKRIHLSAAAPDLMAHYAEREVARLERVAPGISQGVSGPNVATSTGASLEYSVGVGNVSGSASAGRTFFSDDDRDIDFWTSYSVALQGGIGSKFANWAARLNGQAAYAAGGTYFEHDDLRELVKLVANMDANRSWITSSGPKTRKLVHGWEHFKDKVSQGLNRNYVPAPERPYFLTDRKLAKGFNGVKTALLAMALDEQQRAHGGAPVFDAIVAQAYPATGDVLRRRIADHQPLPPAPRRDVPDSVAYADRRVAFREATLAVDGSLGRATDGSANLGADGTFDLLARGDLLQFFTETANAPHQILDPAHHKDFRATLALHQRLDARCGAATPPALRLYDLMRRRLQGAAGNEAMPAMAAPVRELYGDEASIPAQFRNAIAEPSVAQLERAAAEADGLGHLYLNFIEDAATLLARSDRALPRPAREQLDALRGEAFERINAEVWHGGYSRADALARPERFVAASQASISLALGAVGTHLGITKERLSHGDVAHAQAAQQADRGYAEARALLDRLYLPMKKHDVQKNGPLKEQALWQRWDVLVRATASGGAEINALGALLGHWQKSLGPVSIASDTGGLTLSAEAKFLYADHQINPSRVGKFWQITLTANGGKPLAGAALQAAVRGAVGRLNEALATDQPKIDSAEIARQMQGLVFDASEGSTIVMKFRQPPGLGMGSTHLQYVRVLNNQNAGLNLSVTVPTHVGMFTPGISHTDSAQGFEGEIMGSDLSYLMLQHPKLAALLDHPDAATPAGLAARFDAHPRVRNGYFATASTIVDTVQRYAGFLDAKARAARDGTRLEDAPKTNEFFRYYASAPFQRVAETARQVQRHAPGSTAAGAPPTAAGALAEDVSLEGIDLAAARARLEGAKSIRERTAYLCGEGRPLLDAFAAIVGRTREINASAMFHAESRNIGFQAVMREA
ncbi:type III effector protein [Burkholderia plantarii]|uniref:type III effector protein n=1 Tax=Burkholderia plantarii TaxID=41899 RepID=UPI0018DB700D|nr:type III effector protein [Burkholderia plantarii]MBI0327238.1 type III effector protein [Burkholderia plantarii]